MERLSRPSLSRLQPDIETPGYEPDSVTSGIVHFGAGNFHRSHQAVYCDTLLNQGKTSWGITGISLRSPTMRDNLAPQDYLYSQVTLGEKTEYRIVGALQKMLVAPENPRAVIETVAHRNTRLVTTTITEKGYCLEGGEIDHQHPDMIRDIESLVAPQTTYGYLAAALIQRSTEQGAPLTILCCDNMHAGGRHLQNGVQTLLARHSPATLDWVAEHAAFCSSMVDRVTPATDERLRKEVAHHLGLNDAAPVAAEPFSQWIIEDRFAGERPPLDLAGAQFVDDIAPFEQIKLRFLNAGHSLLATLGYLAGDSYIHEALQHPVFARFTEQSLKRNVLPVTTIPDGVSGEAYIDQVLERFRNCSLPYAALQVGTDSSQKIQQRWLPTIDDALNNRSDASYLAFGLAAWVSFISLALQKNDLNDPLREAFARSNFSGGESAVHDFLALAGANKFAFFSDDTFMTSVRNFHKSIQESGVEHALGIFPSA